jgi:hypothetical protein
VLDGCKDGAIRHINEATLENYARFDDADAARSHHLAGEHELALLEIKLRPVRARRVQHSTTSPNRRGTEEIDPLPT